MLREKLRARHASVARLNLYQPARDVIERLIPANPLQRVRPALVVFVFVLQFTRQFRKAFVLPAFPTSPNHRVLHPVWPIKHTMERVALGAMAVAPVVRCFITLNVRIAAHVVLLAHLLVLRRLDPRDEEAQRRRDVGRVDPERRRAIEVGP